MRPGFISFRVTGAQANQAFKGEAGHHRWQRVPPTEKRGRVQSSTVCVAVLHEPAPYELTLDPKDLRIETKRGSGPGGQHRNKTESAVRITHIPTGTQAYCDSRDQHRNKELAMAVLRARLQDAQTTKMSSDQQALRRQQVGLGQRGEKIRTDSEQNGHVVNHTSGKRLDLKRYQRGFVEELY